MNFYCWCRLYSLIRNHWFRPDSSIVETFASWPKPCYQAQVADNNDQTALRPALFLDRDGVINVDTGHLWRIEECRFIDGIFALAAGLSARGFSIVVVTNQSGIGRG